MHLEATYLPTTGRFTEASTPPRPRSDGSVAWQVYFYNRDTGGKRRQFSETFDEFAEAQGGPHS